MPKGDGRVPIVVLVHGSEHDSARDSYPLQRQLPSEGIGAFVYDKRGTGASGGLYSQGYLMLADDAIAAVHEARRLAGDRAGRIGYQAGSQGGWVAPLAARIEPVDFVIVGFGLAVSPLEEDREAIALDMTRNGYGADVMAKAMESRRCDGGDHPQRTFATATNSSTQCARGTASEAVVQECARRLHVSSCSRCRKRNVREQGPALLAGVPAEYDPMPVLRNLDTPQLWILGEDDTEAPSAETARRLRALTAKAADHAGAVSARRPRHLRVRDHGRRNARVHAQPGRLFRDDARLHPQRPCRQTLRRERDLPLRPRLGNAFVVTGSTHAAMAAKTE